MMIFFQSSSQGADVYVFGLGGPVPGSPARSVSGERSADSFGCIFVRKINNELVGLRDCCRKASDLDACKTRHMCQALPSEECISRYI